MNENGYSLCRGIFSPWHIIHLASMRDFPFAGDLGSFTPYRGRLKKTCTGK